MVGEVWGGVESKRAPHLILFTSSPISNPYNSTRTSVKLRSAGYFKIKPFKSKQGGWSSKKHTNKKLRFKFFSSLYTENA